MGECILDSHILEVADVVVKGVFLNDMDPKKFFLS